MEKRVRAVNPVLSIFGSIGKAFKASFETENEEDITEDWKEFSEKNKDNDIVKLINEETRKIRNSEYRRKQALVRGTNGISKTQIQNSEKRPIMKMEVLDRDLQK